jgi:hypothetical protein
LVEATATVRGVTAVAGRRVVRPVRDAVPRAVLVRVVAPRAAPVVRAARAAGLLPVRVLPVRVLPVRVLPVRAVVGLAPLGLTLLVLEELAGRAARGVLAAVADLAALALLAAPALLVVPAELARTAPAIRTGAALAAVLFVGGTDLFPLIWIR